MSLYEHSCYFFLFLFALMILPGSLFLLIRVSVVFGRIHRDTTGVATCRRCRPGPTTFSRKSKKQQHQKCKKK